MVDALIVRFRLAGPELFPSTDGQQGQEEELWSALLWARIGWNKASCRRATDRQTNDPSARGKKARF